MPVPVTDLNIQEKLKTSDKNPPAKPHESAKPHTEAPPQIEELARVLRSPGVTGQVLRVLIRRLRHRDWPYTDNELNALLLLTLALERAGMWP